MNISLYVYFSGSEPSLKIASEELTALLLFSAISVVPLLLKKLVSEWCLKIKH
jgi:hypothetical protein